MIGLDYGVAGAAYTATSKVESIVFQPYSSLGTAISTFAGQNLGAKKYERIKQAVIKAEAIVFAISACLLFIILLFDQQIIHFFVNDSEVIKVGAKGLRIAGASYFALGSIYIFRGALNGVKDVTYSMINGAMEVLGRVVFAALLMYVCGMGYFGIWYTNILTWILVAFVALVRFCWFMRKCKMSEM